MINKEKEIRIMKINDYINRIKELHACEEAIKDAHEHETSQELWDKCERGDWMLWLIGKLSDEPESVSRRKLVATTCKCARLSLQYVAKDELRPLKAIETTEAWANKKEGVTLDDVRNAADAAFAAAYAADAAAYAADAAAYAAYAAFAAYVAVDAVYAAYAATSAAYAATDAAKKETLKKCADIVRQDYPYIDDLFQENNENSDKTS
jgi:hypothetical protein